MVFKYQTKNKGPRGSVFIALALPLAIALALLLEIEMANG